MTIKQLRQDLPAIKETIGYADFPKDELLIQAFVRRSYSQEHPEWQHNQVLEFIGDSVLDAFFVRNLCNPNSKNKFMNSYGSFKSNQFHSSKGEGELTKIKSDYVNGTALAKHVDNKNLAQYLILGGADEKNNVRNKQNVKEDLFEAIVGAVALACNFQNEKIDVVCTEMLELNKQAAKNNNQNQNKKIAEMRKLVGTEKSITSENAVSKLLSLSQKNYISKPVYSYNDKAEYDDDGNPVWKCSCKISGYEYNYYCSGSSKKEAKQYISVHILKFIVGYEKN